MGKYRKILVAFDGSESSRGALREALRLSDTEGSWVKVLAVVPPYEGDLDLTGVGNLDEVIRGPIERLLAEASAIAEAYGSPVTTLIDSGEPYVRIVEVAVAHHCDLIMIGRKGRRSIDKALTGSVTARVIGASRCDVLTVPEAGTLGFGAILVGTDGSACSRAAEGRALDMAASYGSRLSAIRVVESNEEFYSLAPELSARLVEAAAASLESLKDRGRARGIAVEAVVREGEPYEKILEQASAFGAGLIVLGSRGRKAMRTLFMGSVTEKVIGLGGLPVLVVSETSA